MPPPPEPGAGAEVLDGGRDAARLGGKAASLDRLIGWGVEVPPTAVVTADVYRRFVRQPAVATLLERLAGGAPVDDDEVDRRFAEGSLEEADRSSIVEAARRVADGRRLAVRSSATVEDLGSTSFAGQYRSLLDVDPEDADALEAAVVAVFASLWHAAPRAYRAAFGVDDHDAAMAVVLMQMVPARRAGVVFTVDPAGGPDLARVESVSGLAESLVSGAETPEAAVLRRDGTDSAADPVAAGALRAALAIESATGLPQDVEWAWDGTTTWIVQARPITVATGVRGDGFDDDESTLADLDLTTIGIGEMLPGVLPPLVWCLTSHLVEEAFRRLRDDLGLAAEASGGGGRFLWRVRGRAAIDFRLLQSMAESAPGAAAEELEQEYFGSRRRGRRSVGSGARRPSRLASVLRDVRVLRVRQRAALEALAVAEATDVVVAALRSPEGLDTRVLLAQWARLVDLAARVAAVELGVAADAAATHRRLEVLLERHLGADGAGREAEALITRVGVAAPVPAAASAAVFAGRTWEEVGRTPPSLGQRSGAPAREEEALEVLFAHLAETPGWDEEAVRTYLRRRAIRRLAHETTDRLALRERTKEALLVLGGAVRRIHLELGARLVADGHLEQAEDVDLLSPRELRSLLAGAARIAPDELAHRRRWNDRCALDGPLPVRFSGVPTTVEVGELEGDRLEGWAASPGRARGRTVVVHGPDDELPVGAVLVAEATDPSWSPLFMRAAAIVLDRGGPLSHAAILARELGVPAVLNVPGATALLADREVTVDGDAGVVLVHEPEDAG